MSEIGVNSIESSSRQYPFDRTNLKVRREYGATNYEAYALPGTLETDEGWQIAVITREAAAPFEILTRNFAQSGGSKERNAFAFTWSDRATHTYGA